MSDVSKMNLATKLAKISEEVGAIPRKRSRVRVSSPAPGTTFQALEGLFGSFVSYMVPTMELKLVARARR